MGVSHEVHSQGIKSTALMYEEAMSFTSHYGPATTTSRIHPEVNGSLLCWHFPVKIVITVIKVVIIVFNCLHFPVKVIITTNCCCYFPFKVVITVIIDSSNGYMPWSLVDHNWWDFP